MGKKLMMLLLGAFTCLLVNAQVKTVTGHVTSADNGEPLIGVSVSVPGTTIGVNTDADGRFTLSNLPASAKQLRFSFIGMEAQVLPVKSVMNVSLKSNDKMLGGVVVTALALNVRKSRWVIRQLRLIRKTSWKPATPTSCRACRERLPVCQFQTTVIPDQPTV